MTIADALSEFPRERTWLLPALQAVQHAERWLSEPWTAEPPVPDMEREVIFADAAHPLRARIVWRPSLAAGARIEGPAVIEEPNATTLIYPGDVATITGAGHLVIDIALEAAQ